MEHIYPHVLHVTYQHTHVAFRTTRSQVVICDRLHASILSLLMDIPHVLVDGGVDTSSYGKRMMTRAAAFETSDHCTQTSLRYRETATLAEGISDALELLEEYF